jgi:hypothetical protein
MSSTDYPLLFILRRSQMSDNDQLGLFIACMSIGISLVFFLGKDLGWKYELWWRKLHGFPPESLKRNPEFDHSSNVIGAIWAGIAVLAVLYIAVF